MVLDALYPTNDAQEGGYGVPSALQDTKVKEETMPEKDIISQSDLDSLEETSLKSQVTSDLEEARQFAKTMSLEDVKSGKKLVLS